MPLSGNNQAFGSTFRIHKGDEFEAKKNLRVERLVCFENVSV